MQAYRNSRRKLEKENSGLFKGLICLIIRLVGLESLEYYWTQTDNK